LAYDKRYLLAIDRSSPFLLLLLTFGATPAARRLAAAGCRWCHSAYLLAFHSLPRAQCYYRGAQRCWYALFQRSPSLFLMTRLSLTHRRGAYAAATYDRTRKRVCMPVRLPPQPRATPYILLLYSRYLPLFCLRHCPPSILDARRGTSL